MRAARHFEQFDRVHVSQHSRLDKNAAERPPAFANRGCRRSFEMGQIDPHDPMLDNGARRCLEQDFPGIPAVVRFTFLTFISLRHDPEPHITAVKPLHRDGHMTAVIQQRAGRFGNLLGRDTVKFAEVPLDGKHPHERGGPRHGITGVGLSSHATSPSAEPGFA